MRAESREQRVVVEHLLEVRDEPCFVHCITSEAAAELVVDAAARHRAERLLRDRQGERRSRSSPVSEERVERHRLRKLWRTPKSTVAHVVVLRQLPDTRARAEVA